MLIRRSNWREHFPWFIGIVAVSALAILWYISLVSGTPWDRRPSGSSLALFLFGIAGGAICLFEFLLWPRKKYRVLRLGRTQVWMRAHIWLGLLAVPLLILHSGFYFRNLEATVLLILFLIVIVSGVWGLIMQQFLPQRMLDELPAETIYSQIDTVSQQMRTEAERLVMQTCGIQPEEDTGREKTDEQERVIEIGSARHYTIGAVRAVGGLQGKVLHSQASNLEPVPNTEALHAFFENTVSDYLRRGKASGSPLAVHTRAQSMFNDLRNQLPPRAADAVNALENFCDQRRQFDRQARLHFWLHNWLWIHLPLSVALIILMFIHIWRTLQYLWPA